MVVVRYLAFAGWRGLSAPMWDGVCARNARLKFGSRRTVVFGVVGDRTIFPDGPPHRLPAVRKGAAFLGWRTRWRKDHTSSLGRTLQS